MQNTCAFGVAPQPPPASHEAPGTADHACPRHCDFDTDRVNLHNAYEVRWWCQRFVCTESMLRAAVHVVGAHWRDLEAYFRGHSRSPRKPARPAARRGR